MIRTVTNDFVHFSLFTRIDQILAIAAGVLAIFAMASLIAALVINDKSLSNISGRFKDYMFDYQTKDDARTVVDLVQKNKECCGEDIWLDWARVQLNVTDITMSNDTTSTMTTSTTTTEATTTTTTSTTSSSNNSSSADPTEDVNQNPDGRVAVNNPLHSDSYPKQPSSTENNSEKQVSEAGTTYGGINDLPISFGVILPASCCKSEAILLNSTENRCKLKFCRLTLEISTVSFLFKTVNQITIAFPIIFIRKDVQNHLITLLAIKLWLLLSSTVS